MYAQTVKPFKLDKEGREGLGCCTLISTILFLILFFSLTYPEYLESKYINTTCTVIAVTIIPNYKCYKTCSWCSSASYLEPGCSRQIEHLQSLNPSQCDINPAQCAKEKSYCNNGYYCCRTACHTCKSCKTDQHGNKKCTEYPCNCYCASEVWNHLCTIHCYQVYTSKVTFSFPVEGSTESSSVSKYFDKSIQNANEYIQRFPIGYELDCYYDPAGKINQRKLVLYNNFFTTWKIVIMVLFGVVPLFCCFFIWTLVGLYTITEEGLILNISLWFGLLIPLGVLLPIAQCGYGVDKSDWMTAMIVVLIAGNVPGLLKGGYFGYNYISRVCENQNIPIAEVSYEPIN